MYNKTIIEFGFCGIQDNQGLGKCNQPRPYLDLDYSGYHKNLIQLLFIILIKSQDEVTNYETARDNILSF